MGEVYRAHDIRLRRDVALKVLPETFAADPDRQARFEREAHVLASLNHPHIAAIYGVEEAHGTRALVMELVQGPTLADRILLGPVPVAEALPVARQIAEALEAAHDAGVIHRDLKPANIKLRTDGTVKVLDFGLAKAVASQAPPQQPDYSPTVTSPETLTAAGVLLGTAAYMSPEQARGRPLDKQTDIWAFGCVLFEMLTGRPAFGGATLPDILGAVLEREPDWDSLPRTTPPRVRRVLRRCLAKEIRARMHDVGDVRLELETVDQEEVDTPKPRNRSRPIAASLATGVLLGAAFASVLLWPSPVPRAAAATKFALRLSGTDTLGGAPGFAISPDGKRIVFVAGRGGARQLFLRELDAFDARPLPGTDDATQPFFSPDGLSVGFFANAKLKRVAISGGAAIVLADAVAPRGGTWGVTNRIVFAPTPSAGLQQVPASGGAPEQLTTPDRTRGEGGHRWPQFLPDGRSIVFAAGPATSNTNWSEARIVLLAIETRRRLDLVSRGTYPRYIDGVLFYVEGGALLARPLDLSQPQLDENSTVVLEHVAEVGNGSAQLAISDNGTLAAAVGTEREPQPLVWVDRSGAEEPLSIAPARYATPRLSPDGHHVAVVVSTDNSDIWLFDLDRSTSVRLTSEAGNLAPVWSPDNSRIAFGSNRRGSSEVYWTRADRQGGEEQLTDSDGIQLPTSWSRSTGGILVTSVNAASNVDILMLPRPGAPLVPVVRTSFAEERAVFSPTAPYLAYMANDTGQYEVYVRGLPPDERRWPVSAGGGTDPVWRPDGRELFFRRGDDLMAVDITAAPELKLGKPHKLFSGRYASGVIAGYDVNADGSRFLMVRDTRQQELRELRVAVGWLQEVRSRLLAASPPTR